MVTTISLWGFVGGVFGAIGIGTFTFALRFITQDQNWFLLRIRYWLVVIGAVAGFVLGSSVQVTRAQLAEANEYLNRGDLNFARGDYARTIEDYNQSVRSSPNLERGYYSRGLAEYAKGDKKAASADFSQAIQLNPDNMSAYYYRAMLRQDELRFRNFEALDSMINDLGQVIRLNPKLADAYQYQGRALYLRAQYSWALSDYDEAIRLNAALPNVFRERADIRRAVGDNRGAIADYTQAIRLNPKDVQSYIERGDVRRALGDFTSA